MRDHGFCTNTDGFSTELVGLLQIFHDRTPPLSRQSDQHRYPKNDEFGILNDGFCI